MKQKANVFVFILLLVFCISTVDSIKAQTQTNSPEHYTLIYFNGLNVTLETPWYVSSNSTFNITLIVKAVWAYLEDITINVTAITTFVDDNEISLVGPMPYTIDELDINCSETYRIAISLPEEATRMVMGEIICKWRIRDGESSTQRTRFPIAIIADYWKQQANYWMEQADYWMKQAQILEGERNYYKMQYEKLEGSLSSLQEAYNNLTKTYSQLNQTYHELEDKYNRKVGELGTAQQLSIIFGVTTALFAFTTIYLFRRKPQVW